MTEAMDSTCSSAGPDLAAFLGWTALRRLLPLQDPFFEEWDAELYTLLAASNAKVF